MVPRPAFLTMWSKFNEIYGDGTVASVGKKIGGKVEENIKLGEKDPESGFTNACAIRMSYALNYSGVTVTRGSWSTVSGGDKKWYIFRVVDMMRFLNHSFGKSDKIKKSPKQSDFAKQQGIIVFNVSGWSSASGHATLWNGNSCSDNCYFPLATEASLWILK